MSTNPYQPPPSEVKPRRIWPFVAIAMLFLFLMCAGVGSVAFWSMESQTEINDVEVYESMTAPGQ